MKVENILYHFPMSMDPNPSVGCQIRPANMLQAFRGLGINVDVIAGHSAERAAQINRIKTNIRGGKSYAFMYAESANLPSLITDPHRWPLRPYVDFRLFSYLQACNIPIGLFYRDVYWRFDDWEDSWPWWKDKLAKYLYAYDLRQYEKYVTKLYLPSLRMGDYVPYVSPDKFLELPPGSDVHSSEIRKRSSGINLLYVGGIGELYQLHALVDAVAECPGVNLTICTRENEWRNVSCEYKIVGSVHNIAVVHICGKDLSNLYEEADLAVLFLKPSVYRTFASPIKLFEYVGRKLPIIASSGTLVGDFVSKNDIGWSVPYEKGALIALLNELLEKRSDLDSKRSNLNEIAGLHTWRARALKVCSDFSPLS